MEKGRPETNLKTVHPYLEMEIVPRQQNLENLHLFYIKPGFKEILDKIVQNSKAPHVPFTYSPYCGRNL